MASPNITRDHIEKIHKYIQKFVVLYVFIKFIYCVVLYLLFSVFLRVYHFIIPFPGTHTLPHLRAIQQHNGQAPMVPIAAYGRLMDKHFGRQ